MEENKEIAGNENVGTANDNQVEDNKSTTDEKTPVVENETKTETSETLEKTFNQSQVDEIIGNRVKRFFKRYGVENREELDGLVGKAQSYEVMNEEFETLTNENKSLKEKVAFLENNINLEREADIKAYFKGKDMEFSSENLKAELQNHPEWLKVAQKSENPITTIEKLSPDRGKFVDEESEQMRWRKLYGFKN